MSGSEYERILESRRNAFARLFFSTIKPRSLSDLGPSSRDGRDACVARVTRDGHPGLGRSRDCAAQWRPRPDWRECEAHSGDYVTSILANMDPRPAVQMDLSQTGA